MKNKHYTNVSDSPTLRNLRKSVLVSLVFLLAGMMNSYAAVNVYTFSQSTGTYTALSASRTIVFTATSGATADPGLGDDQNYAGTIPFSFTFNGTAYTAININSNGFVTFGATLPTSSDRTGISNSTGWSGSIAAMGRDLSANTNAANLGEISYETVGSAPNRTFVVQYSKFRRFSSSSTFTENYNFQIRLNEGGGVASAQTVDIIYGAAITTSTSTTAGPQVGLRGATNADFIARTTTTAWNSTTAGGANTAFMRHTTTINPASGQTYTFTPPNNCSAALGGSITPTTASRCSGTTYAMSSTGFSTGLGATYQWQVSNTPGGPYTNVSGGSGATSTAYTTGALTPGVYYYVMQTTCANCGPCSGLSNELTLTVNSLPTVIATPTSATICQPGTTTDSIFASGASTYLWSPSTGLSSTTAAHVNALPPSTTTYTVTGTDANGCTGTATSTITVAAAVTLSSVVADPPSVCAGGSTTLTANAGSAVTYCTPVYTQIDGTDGIAVVELLDEFGSTSLFSRSSGLQALPGYDDQTALTTTNLTAGTNYQLKITITASADNVAAFIDFNGDGDFADAGETIRTSVAVPASGTNTVTFSVPAGAFNGPKRLRVVERFSSAATSCNTAGFGETEDYTVIIDGGVDQFTYLWSESPSSGTLGSTSGNPTSASGINVDQVYSVIVTSGSCSASGSVNVTAGSALSCTNITNTPACDGNSFNVTAHSTGGGAPYNYVWSDGIGGVYPDAATVSATLPAGSYSFSVTVYDACGSSCTMNQSITVGSAPGGVATGPATGFTYQNLQYIVSGYASGSTFQWQSATSIGGPYSNISGVTNDTADLSAASAGTFYIQAIVTGPTGCVSVAGPITTVVSVAGDNVCEALPLSYGLNGPYTNVGATVEPGESEPGGTSCTGQTGWCSDQHPSNSIWYTFVAPASGRISIHFSPGNWDSEIALWSANTCGELLDGSAVLLAANDDSSGNSPYNAFIDAICVVPGQTYYVQVDGYSTTTNSAFGLLLIEENISDGDACTADACDPVLGVTHTPISYDDNNVCTIDACDPITGVSHTTINYDDNDACTTDACDPITGPSHTTIDLDSDGFTTCAGDCDDLNAAVNPSATEVCNGIDDDCDGSIDEGVIPGTGSISGSPISLCWPVAPGIGSYTISAIPNATTYTWSVPAGMIITGGQGTATINIQWTAVGVNNGIIGNVSCIASNACGAGPASVLPIAITAVKPVTPGSVSGPAKVCPGDIAVYSVAPVARASFYQWTLPTGMTLVGSGSGNVISVTVDGSFTGGSVSAAAGNPCGVGPVRVRAVSQNLPTTPGVISGQTSGVCGELGMSYSIAPVANASSYSWSVGAGASIPGATNGLSVAVDFSGSLVSTTISVSAVNGCGTSAARNLSVTGAPGLPSAITGATSVCTGATNHYSVSTVVGATSYTWTAPGTIISGQGTKEIDATWGASPATGQQITVRASNGCGNGPLRTLGGVNISFCPRISSIEADLNAYPNPATDLVTVTFTTQSDYTLKLVDVTGRIVSSVSTTANGGQTELLNVSKLETGVYMIMLETENGTQQLKLFVD